MENQRGPYKTIGGNIAYEKVLGFEEFQSELSVHELWVVSYELWVSDFVEYWGSYAPKNFPPPNFVDKLVQMFLSPI